MNPAWKYIFAVWCLFTCCILQSSSVNLGYPIQPVDFTAVRINDSFWSPRLSASKNVTIPLALQQCEESGRYLNFVKAARPDSCNIVDCNPYDDTDVYKTIEGASYLLQTFPDSALNARLDNIISLIARAQQPDGYLMTAYTMNPWHPHPWIGPDRWGNVESLSHEFYNLGHLIESAIAHYRATGKRTLLDVAKKYADCVCREIGIGDGQADRVPGHQIAESALAKLYVTTGDVKYLNQAKYFLDRRGYTSRTDEYSQAHLPVISQDEAVGHAVRAVYMYTGMADVAALTGDSLYISAVERLWNNIVNKKYYLTGGIGARQHLESFGDNYELPNHEAYCETCASIGNVMLNHRLFLLSGDSKYYDVLERTLYNSLLAGVSLSGNAFFYPNPLASDGGYRRKPWFGTACCPSNISRFIPSLPGYIYACKENALYLNLYIANEADLNIGGNAITISQSGDYVWKGKTSIEIQGDYAHNFQMKLRIPGWARNRVVPGDLYEYSDTGCPQVKIYLNGRPIENVSIDEKGYVTLERRWERGDRVDLDFDIQPRLVKSHPLILNNHRKVAIERGTIVYCAESCDNIVDLDSIEIYPATFISSEKSPELNGIIKLTAKGTIPLSDGLHNKAVDLKLIPYYGWAQRDDGKMRVWLPVKN